MVKVKNKKNIAISLFLLIIIVVSSIFVYKFSDRKIVIKEIVMPVPGQSFKSSDGEYTIQISINVPYEAISKMETPKYKDYYYITAILIKNDNKSNNSKVIYLNKYNVISNPEWLYNRNLNVISWLNDNNINTYVKWLDNKTVEINGQKLNIKSDIYDYRKK